MSFFGVVLIVLMLFLPFFLGGELGPLDEERHLFNIFKLKGNAHCSVSNGGGGGLNEEANLSIYGN